MTSRTVIESKSKEELEEGSSIL